MIDVSDRGVYRWLAANTITPVISRDRQLNMKGDKEHLES